MEAKNQSEQGHDHRLTVIDWYLTPDKADTIVNAIATQPGKDPQTKWFRFRFRGRVDVEFGWLIGILDADTVRFDRIEPTRNGRGKIRASGVAHMVGTVKQVKSPNR